MQNNILLPEAIKNTANFDFYDALKNVKGVHTNQSSLNFTSANTRGFASVGNTRFVQLVDGLDVASAMLNFPMGNVSGNSELDLMNGVMVFTY
ncbi:MAG: TonB-dependent receptor plug domain-containing protein [Bacteroidota bacterium]